MEVIGKLFDGPLDIVGDIHGEVDSLNALLIQLGYNERGLHPDGRRLVFVGDLVDRGPDSPAVVETVKSLVESGVAQCVLGNHELNIVLEECKHGGEWFFPHIDDPQSQMKAVDKSRRKLYQEFFERLPLALERDDLRVIHACWHQDSIDKLKTNYLNGDSYTATHKAFEAEVRAELEREGMMEKYEQEKQEYGDRIEYKHNDPCKHWPNPLMLEGHAAVDEAEQMGNPIKVLTSGVERKAVAPFHASGKFRFVERIKWWNEYSDDKPVVIGHYWRKFREGRSDTLKDLPNDLFAGIEPDQWFGPNYNVYCVDFSVGLAAQKRANNEPTDGCNLAALRWPERTVLFDNGHVKSLVQR